MSHMKLPGTDPEDLQNMPREDLIARVKQLEAHVKQLKNILGRQNGKDRPETETNQKKTRDFNFKRYRKRHVALKFCYLGWDYQGLVVQEDTVHTIEAKIFDALLRTRLIESIETANYHRCGRTDKGVSAFGQVISIDLRSNLLEGKGIIVEEDSLAHERGGATQEINYARILNKVLPPEIRILAWAPTELDFNARFHCNQRTYKYYFPKGNLNIKVMREASQALVGEHDFRNFCKMDVANGVVNYVRHVLSVDINPVTSAAATGDAYQIYEFVVVGKAFLWHQIRCMVAVLMLIGQGLEKPDIIRELLDTEKNPCKPQYGMALALPLILFDCDFENVNWEYDDVACSSVLSSLQDTWCQQAIKAEMLRQMLHNLETGVMKEVTREPVECQTRSLNPSCHSKVYKPLLSRPQCESLEARMKHFGKRRKLVSKNEVPT